MSRQEAGLQGPRGKETAASGDVIAHCRTGRSGNPLLKYLSSVESAAKEARRAVDDEREREELKEAEKVGKSHRADIVGDGGVGAPVKKR